MSEFDPVLVLPHDWGDARRWAAAFLAGFKSLETRRSYRRDLECWFLFCASHSLDPCRGLRRTHIEVYPRELEAQDPPPGKRDVVPANRHAQFVVPLARGRRPHSRQPGGARPPASTPPATAALVEPQRTD